MARIFKEIELTENGRLVLETRYLRRDLQGRLMETPVDLFVRVARSVASMERRERSRWEDEFLQMMLSRRFLPNTPTLLNAGQMGGQLSACYVLPIEDSLEGIFESLKQAAVIHQSGGGTGFSFSRVREKGSRVRSSQGTASGPVSFLRVFDLATETIKQGGARRGANMAVLNVHHPDILEFIDSKRNKTSITNFNISVGVTDVFMRAVESDSLYEVVPIGGSRERVALPARDVFRRLVASAWDSGDPGLLFLDRINQFNPTPKQGQIESTNPCGEQPLLPYESCNLGSLNLGQYFRRDRTLDWDAYRDDIHRAVRFLDNVIDLNCFSVKQSERITHRNRKIGLGVMGFADLILMMGIPYDSPGARALGERLMSFLDREAKSASMALAEKRGAFPNWKGSLWDRLGYRPLRNATVSTVAPTGTISIIAGASSGIEPIFGASFVRNVLSGKKLREVHPAVKQVMKTQGVSDGDLTDERVGDLLGEVWSPAQKVTIEGHVAMQAVFQRHSDSAVSKTINLPENAKESDVERAYLLAYRSGCKGITVYRDRSRPTQVLEHSIEQVSCDVCNE